MGVMSNLSVERMLKRSQGKHGFAVFDAFFDKPAVMRAVGEAAVKNLSRAGAYVRRTMKTSIRKRKRTSKPGEPPSSHAGQLRDFIYFSFDPQSESVVIGPERLNAKIGSTPEVLEYGGDNVVATYRRSGYKKGDNSRIVSKRTIHVKARPFAQPALEKELPKLPEMWRNSVKSKV